MQQRSALRFVPEFDEPGSEILNFLYTFFKKNRIRTNERGDVEYEDLSTQRHMKKGNLTTEKHSYR